MWAKLTAWTHRLVLANVLETLDIDNLLAHLSAAARRLLLQVDKVCSVLQQLSQGLRGRRLLIVRIHLVRIRVVLLLLLLLRVGPVGHRVQLQVLSAQAPNILLSTNDILRFRDTQLPQSLVTRQGDRNALIVTIMPQSRHTRLLLTALFIRRHGGRRLAKIRRNRSGARIKEEKLSRPIR